MKSKKKSILDFNLLYIFIAIIVGFIIGAIFLAIVGFSPAEVYGKLFGSVFSKPKYMVWTLMYAAPIMMTGLSVAFSFRTGVFNIGAEGQFVVGEMAAVAVAIFVDVPAVIHVPLCILAAACAGACWSLICGLMKVKRGIHEVLSFIMFNWIAYYLANYFVNLPAVKAEGKEASRDILESASIMFPEKLVKLLDCSSANWGIVIAVVLAVVMWIIIEKTTLGYKLKAVGFNKDAAQYGGINANGSILSALGISGALSGIGGAILVLGMGGRLSQFAGQEGYGFEGITVALIGSSNPLGCILSAIFYGAMKYGGSKLTMIKAPAEVIDIIMGCVIIVIAISHIFKILFKKIGKKEAK